MSEEIVIIDNNPVEVKVFDKVYVNFGKLLKDYRDRTGIKLRIEDVSKFIYSKEEGTDTAKRVKLSRKVGEISKYELTITEIYNICQVAGISISDFFINYTLAQ